MRRVPSSTSVIDGLPPVRRSPRLAARRLADVAPLAALEQVLEQALELAPFSRFELATQFVLNWTILLLCVVIYFALSCDPPRWDLAAALGATIIASVMHWSRVRYGGWRHKLDGAVAASTVAWHTWRLHHDPTACSVHMAAAWLCLIFSACSFFLGWQRHLGGFVGQGMCCHLSFRFGAFWPLALTQVHHRFNAHDWMAFISVMCVSYAATAWALWRLACWIYQVPRQCEQHSSKRSVE